MWEAIFSESKSHFNEFVIPKIKTKSFVTAPVDN